jgi:hypothetical protein
MELGDGDRGRCPTPRPVSLYGTGRLIFIVAGRRQPDSTASSPRAAARVKMSVSSGASAEELWAVPTRIDALPRDRRVSLGPRR